VISLKELIRAKSLPRAKDAFAVEELRAILEHKTQARDRFR